ncbi:MAG: 2-amino-4-hydroxy-6-hydroxymethyldihydropteridine diphosphokinase [Thermodesulfobacteriota bacterium]
MNTGTDDWVDILVGLGANLSEPEKNIDLAADKIAHLSGVKQIKLSPKYFTEPQDLKNQPWFVNAAGLYQVSAAQWTARSFLRALLEIENIMGRKRKTKQGPRIVDLDLLIFGETKIDSPELTLPHPRMHKRAFVLVPVLNICPELCFPGGTKVKEMLEEIEYTFYANKIWQN